LTHVLGYAAEDLEKLPEAAVASAFGCGNPLAFSGVQPGQVVLDIGSGAGIDCLLAAQKVGPTGCVIGLDMTPAMLARAVRAIPRPDCWQRVERPPDSVQALN